MEQLVKLLLDQPEVAELEIGDQVHRKPGEKPYRTLRKEMLRQIVTNTKRRVHERVLRKIKDSEDFPHVELSSPKAPPVPPPRRQQQVEEEQAEEEPGPQASLSSNDDAYVDMWENEEDEEPLQKDSAVLRELAQRVSKLSKRKGKKQKKRRRERVKKAEL
ncbi:hypothetical protein GPECTOR_1g261 [Gonium pectorale]|uniref:Uncharacterized protein n=1 Tax=Gonium pectorale TaxID=33097 RepID=A0A150H2B6_GONPE|nr:hypothetical protein GPECTOR_1g261 [Gonium pectorale]|eukprot:KXZ56297.1 hypothetical protein GPECTOR_1g261 [Gonium pectorale]